MARLLLTTITRRPTVLRFVLASISLIMLGVGWSGLVQLIGTGALNLLSGLAIACIVEGFWQTRHLPRRHVVLGAGLLLALALALAPAAPAMAAPPVAPPAAPAAAPTTAGVYYPLLDHQGSLRAMTDSSGIVKLRQSYDPWGHVRARTGPANLTTLGWAGERVGTADGLIWLRARHYAPALGRFLQRDSFAGDPTNPQSLNRYAGLEGNPVNLRDPSGHCASGAVVDTLVCLTVAEKVVLTLIAGGAAYLAIVSNKPNPKRANMSASELQMMADVANGLAGSLRAAGVRVATGSDARGQVLTINKGDFERLAAKFGKVRFGKQASATGGGPNGKPPWNRDQKIALAGLAMTIALFFGHPVLFTGANIVCERMGICGAGRIIATDEQRAIINKQNEILATQLTQMLQNERVGVERNGAFVQFVQSGRAQGWSDAKIAREMIDRRPELWERAFRKTYHYVPKGFVAPSGK